MQKTRISVLALATLVLQSVVPAAAIAAGTCQVSALDTVAGLGTQVNIVNCATNTSFEMTLTGPGTSAYAQTVVTDANGNAVTLIPSKVTVTSGTYRVIAADKSASFTVMPDRADDTHSSISATPRTVSAGGGDTVTVTAVLRDRYDNPVSGRPLALISNRSTDDVSGRSAETDDDGRFIWTVRPTEAGRATFVPYDIVSGRQMKLKVDVTVGNATVNSSWLRGSLTGFEQGGEEEDFLLAQAAGTTPSSLVDRFELELPQAATEVQANELFSMTIRAMRGDSVVRSYIGSLNVESSDPDAELPKKGQDPKAPELGRIDFLNVHQGVSKVPLSFALRRTGEQIISVYDKLDPSIRGQIALTVIRDGSSEEKIVILDPKDRAHIKSGETVLLQGKAPSFTNLRVKGGLRDVDGESDSEGVFRIEVPLAQTDKEATFFVTSENGTYESEAVHVIIDSDAPVIVTAEVNPSVGKTETPALVTLQTEPGAVVSLNLNGTDVSLTETGSITGMYSGTITAPKLEGIYDLKFSATDSVGNVGNMLLKWTVAPRTVGTVQNVKAESQAGQVSLSWDALEGTPVTEYKIYIAKNSDPTNYLYSIGTQEPVTSAVIKDLPSGEVYQFSLTAISKDGQESDEKSAPVTASPLGLVLKATPGPDSVLLEWSAVPNLPLSSYTLEMGTEPGVYLVKQTVNGEASSFMMRDLISGVTYEFRLTLTTVTGKPMPEMSGIAHATPGGDGFVMSAEDPAPDDVFTKLHSGGVPDPNLKDVPSVTSSGISSMAFVIALLLSLVLGMSWLRMRREHKMTRDFLQMMQDKYSA